MATTIGMITVAEFERQIRDHVRLELRHGEVVRMPPAGMPHFWAARRLRQALERLLGPAGVVDREVPFRPLPEYEVWLADVAFVSELRARTAQDSWLMGAPDLVIEVLSPSNTAHEMDERRDICLENGCAQFWVVNLERKLINVSKPDGTTTTYRLGGVIDLVEFCGGKLPVAEVFGSVG